jgi:hypothetical protein
MVDPIGRPAFFQQVRIDIFFGRVDRKSSGNEKRNNQEQQIL